MNYTKPEVNTLGEASALIESQQSKPGSSTDNQGSSRQPNPAYDLDE